MSEHVHAPSWGHGLVSDEAGEADLVATSCASGTATMTRSHPPPARQPIHLVPVRSSPITSACQIILITSTCS